jgi:NAD(P)-dependent dehydrogenase (short-subunit alcohol dehydrogenase family)
VIAGGARGIGCAYAVHLSEHGYDVAIADLTEPIGAASADGIRSLTVAPYVAFFAAVGAKRSRVVIPANWCGCIPAIRRP